MKIQMGSPTFGRASRKVVTYRTSFFHVEVPEGTTVVTVRALGLSVAQFYEESFSLDNEGPFLLDAQYEPEGAFIP